ncbi:MAG: lipopolysaccharide kinase InaA family protein, partial [Planctomycetota bacterium]
LALVSERIEGTRDLATLLEGERRGEGQPRERQQLTRELGQTLRTLHELGFEHVDLQLRNLLARSTAPDGQRLWVIDLDRSRLGPPLPTSVRERNLARLIRSARRRNERGAPVLTATDLARLLIAYAGRDAWRTWLAEVEARGQRSTWRHRLGWWLEQRAGADPATRDGTAKIR